jgi:recombination protein RecR
MYSDSMKRLVDELSRLPGIGRKTAERLAFHILKLPADEAMKLAYAIRDVKQKTVACSICCNVSDHDPCHICTDAERDQGVICVIEQPKDLLVMEKSGCFRGVYHVLMGTVSFLDGVDADELTLRKLEARVKAGGVREVIIATNPNFEGDGTALCIRRQLEPYAVKLTRIARGIPSGSTLEYASKTILTDALEGRREMPPGAAKK